MNTKRLFLRCRWMGVAPIVLCSAFSLWAADLPRPTTYEPVIASLEQYKKPFDDPRPFLKDHPVNSLVPKAVYQRVAFDIDAMKTAWADAVGFSAPDLVGKIAPEIKPGKYTYRDLEKYPGLKTLMPPLLYERIKPGGPPFCCNIPEFEIIPTRQYYYSLPVSKATKENMGKAKLDSKGYLVGQEYYGGLLFPRPSGQFKAQQIIFTYQTGGGAHWNQSYGFVGQVRGYDSHLNNDYTSTNIGRGMNLSGRVLLPPFGYTDERAKARGELGEYVVMTLSPRDSAGSAFGGISYFSPSVNNVTMMYLPALRRVRLMGSTDTQDPLQGQDTIMEDNQGFMQKLTPDRYPYKYEIIEEREFLMPALSEDGAEYVASKGLELRNVRLERRPMYVLQLTQLDRNYVYSKRILYIDKETFLLMHMATYDQKGRLYRTSWTTFSWHPDMGTMSQDGGVTLVTIDHIDKHSGYGGPNWAYPANFRREDVSMETLYRKGK